MNANKDEKPAYPFCVKCGFAVSDSGEFCKNCGAALQEAKSFGKQASGENGVIFDGEELENGLRRIKKTQGDTQGIRPPVMCYHPMPAPMPRKKKWWQWWKK